MPETISPAELEPIELDDAPVEIPAEPAAVIEVSGNDALAENALAEHIGGAIREQGSTQETYELIVNAEGKIISTRDAVTGEEPKRRTQDGRELKFTDPRNDQDVADYKGLQPFADKLINNGYDIMVDEKNGQRGSITAVTAIEHRADGSTVYRYVVKTYEAVEINEKSAQEDIEYASVNPESLQFPATVEAPQHQEALTQTSLKAKRPFWAEWLANTPTYEIDTKETTLTELFPATVVTLHHDQPTERAAEEVLQAIAESSPGTEAVIAGAVVSPTHEVTDVVILRRGEASTQVEYQFIDRPHAEAFPLNEHWEAPSGTAQSAQAAPERAASPASAAEPATIDVTAAVRQSLVPAPVVARQVLGKQSDRREFGAGPLIALLPVPEHTDSSRRSFQAEPPPAPTTQFIDHYFASPPTPESNNETKIAVPPKPDTFRYYVISKGQPRPVIESGVSTRHDGESTGVDPREMAAATDTRMTGGGQVLRSETLIKSPVAEAPDHEPRRVTSFVRNDSISNDAKREAAAASPRQLTEHVENIFPAQPMRAVRISSPGHEQPVAVHQSPRHTMSSSPHQHIDTSVPFSAAGRERPGIQRGDATANAPAAIAPRETSPPITAVVLKQQRTVSPSPAATSHRELTMPRPMVRELPGIPESSTSRPRAAEERGTTPRIERSTPVATFSPERSAPIPTASAQKESLPLYRRIDPSVQPPAAVSDAPETALADTPVNRPAARPPQDRTQRRRVIDGSASRQSPAAERVRQPVTVHPIVYDDQAITAAPSTTTPRRARQAVKRQVV